MAHTQEISPKRRRRRHVSVSVYVCVRASVCMCVYSQMHTLLCTRTYTHTCTRILAYTRSFTHVQTEGKKDRRSTIAIMKEYYTCVKGVRGEGGGGGGGKRSSKRQGARSVSSQAVKQNSLSGQ